MKSFVLKREIWYVCTQTDLISESIPFSIRTSLILLMSADHASGVWLLDCSKLAINWKMTMTSLCADKTSSSSFWRCRVSLNKFSYWCKFHVSIIGGHYWFWNYGSFFNKGFLRNLEMGNATTWVLFNIWRLGWVRVTKLMLQTARFTVFTVSELLRENQERGRGIKNILATIQISFKMSRNTQ